MKTQEAGLNAFEPQSRRLHAAAGILLMTALVGVIFLTGCTKNSDSSGNLPSLEKGPQDPVSNNPPPPPPPVIGQQESAPATTSVMEPAMIALQKGDKSMAVSRFVEANWSARPLFAPGSTFSLSETQFMSLSSSDRNAKSNDAIKQLGDLRELVRAVLQAGHDAAMKKDSAQARKYFTSLKQCGEALDSPDCLLLVSQFGKYMKKTAGEELARLGQ